MKGSRNISDARIILTQCADGIPVGGHLWEGRDGLRRIISVGRRSTTGCSRTAGLDNGSMRSARHGYATAIAAFTCCCGGTAGLIDPDRCRDPPSRPTLSSHRVDKSTDPSP
jgi:hypothetical protein